MSNEEAKIECRRLAASVEKAGDKQLFHSRARHLLRYYVENVLNRGGDFFDIRTNYGGPAVPGETILHTDSLYVQIIGGLTQYGEAGPIRVMYRSCKGHEDYTGGRNHWCNIHQVADITVPLD